MSRPLLLGYVDERTPSECWPWTGRINAAGYGSFGKRLAHRLMYERGHGPIPTAMDLDHVCHSADAACPGGLTCQHRRCVNPAHLEPVTRKENRRRAAYRTDTCINGHPRTPPYLYLARYPRGLVRRCRACDATNTRRYLMRKARVAA